MEMKKLSALLMAGLLCVGTLSGCGGQSSDTAGDNSGSGEKEKIVVANWQSYATDSDYGAAAFEEEYGCEVEHYFINSVPELLSVLQNGGAGNIDVVNINPLYLQQYLDAGVLETLDTSRLENYDNLREDFRNIDEVKDADGNIIGVPWVWGTTSMFYNPDIITDAPTSWSALWDPANAGLVTLENEYDTAIRTAALYTGQDPANPNMDTVKDALMTLKGNTKTFWTSHDDFVKAYTAGEIAIGNVWGSIATQLKAEGYNIEYVHPDEGTVGWCDYWCIVSGTQHEDMVYNWLNFVTGEEFQTNMGTAGVQVYAPVNTVVTDKLTDEQKARLWMYPEAPSNVHLALPLSTDVLQTWTSTWDAVKAGS